MVMNKVGSLVYLFFQYILTLAASLIIAVFIPYQLYVISINMDVIYPANIIEMQAITASSILTSAPNINNDMIPPVIEYARLSKTLAFKDSNMDDESLKLTNRYIRGQYDNSNPKYRFLLITREDEYIVLKYHTTARFTNESLSNIFPDPENLMLTMMGVMIAFAFLVSTTLLIKKLRNQIKPLQQVSRNIEVQNLDFNLEKSSIKEINDALSSFYDMKEELRSSLEKQWRSELNHKEQIAALAHDLKTPLTIVMGNAELLEDTSVSDEQSGYIKGLMEGISQMEKAIKSLIDISRAESGYSMKLSPISGKSIYDNLLSTATNLAFIKGLTLNTHISELDCFVMGDITLLERAFQNILANAVEYSSSGGAITIHITTDEQHLNIAISDTGPGFSLEALSLAKERLYVGDKSRSNKHHGMGLYIADRIISQHGGTLTLKNQKDNYGATVLIKLKI